MSFKQVVSLFLCFIVILFFCSCNNEKESALSSPDFRNVFWGDSRSVVEDSEETEYVFALDDLILFEGKVGDEDASIYYVFDGDSLSEVQCEIEIYDRTLNELIDSFNTLSDILTSEYGDALLEDVHEYLREPGDNEGDADNLLLYYNIIQYKQQWKNETTLFTLSLEYVDNQIMYELLVQPYANEAESAQ